MKILVIEDEKSLIEFLKKGLKCKGYEVDLAATGSSGIKKAREHIYDVILLDILLPGKEDGFEVCKILRESGVKTPILMLTALGTAKDKIKGLEIGADDYLTKPFDFEELIARIKSLVRRSQKSPTAVLRVGGLTLDPASNLVKRDGQTLELSHTEHQLLLFLIQHKNEVISRQKILEEVWHYDFDPHSNIVDVYMRYLRRKVDRRGLPKLIRTVRGAGYKLSAKKG